MELVFPATSVLQYLRQFRLKILCKTFWESASAQNVQNTLSSKAAACKVIRDCHVTSPENISG